MLHLGIAGLRLFSQEFESTERHRGDLSGETCVVSWIPSTLLAVTEDGIEGR